MFTALSNTRPSHLLDPSIFDFKGLNRGSDELDNGDLSISGH
jgi:tRNA 2-thiocytidine biosynthesis protein TtcA